MSKRDIYNNYLKELISMGYGNCTAETLPLNQRTILAELDFDYTVDAVEKVIESMDNDGIDYYGDRAFNKFIFWYINKNKQILNKHCKS